MQNIIEMLTLINNYIIILKHYCIKEKIVT